MVNKRVTISADAPQFDIPDTNTNIIPPTRYSDLLPSLGTNGSGNNIFDNLLSSNDPNVATALKNNADAFNDAFTRRGINLEVDAEGNLKFKDRSVQATPDATTPDASNPEVTPENATQLNSTKNQFTDAEMNRLQTNPGAEVPELTNKASELSNGKISKDQLEAAIRDPANADVLKKIRDGYEMPLSVVGWLIKKFGQIIFSKPALIFAALFLLYQIGLENLKKQARENREQCQNHCKPQAFGAWTVGAISLTDLSDPDTTNTNMSSCYEETCWNSSETISGSKTDIYCSEATTATAPICSSTCEDHCKSKYPNPSFPADFGKIMTEGVKDGVLDPAKELGKEVTDPFLDFFNKLFGEWLLWLILPVAVIFLGALAFVFFRKTKSRSNVYKVNFKNPGK